MEIGEVLPTARIIEVLRQFVAGVVTGNLAASEKAGEGKPGDIGGLARLAKGKDALGIERNRKFGAPARLDLRQGKPKAACNGFRNIGMKGHSVTGSAPVYMSSP